PPPTTSVYTLSLHDALPISIELEGTYPLPEAQLDRFFFKLLVPFPDAEELAEIARRTTGVDEADLQPVASAEDLAAMARLAREVDRKSTRLNSSHRTISYAV